MLEKLKRMDWSIVIIMLLFMGISTLLVHSAIQFAPEKYPNYVQRNIMFYAAGLIALFVAAFFNYRWLMKVSMYLYWIGIMLLIAVKLFGANINGASGWFKLGAFSFQPAELMKLLIILYLANILAKRKDRQLDFKRDIIPIGLFVFLPFALVMIQPDLGNAIIYIAILFGILWIGNLKYIHAIIGLVILVVGIIGFYFTWQTYHDPIVDFLTEHNSPHWAERIDTFLNPDLVDRDKSYQVRHSRIAIGTGGLTGEGYLQGDYISKGYVPLTYSDSIFTVVGEEFGFIGASVLLLLYFLLIYRLIWIAIQCDEPKGSIMIVGIVSMFVFQIFQNIGMSIGIMPLTGITLPFVSYGGTSLLINMTCIGIAMSTRLHQKKPSMF